MTPQHKLLMEALHRAKSKHDIYNMRRFKNMKAGNLTPAEIQDLQHYLENT